MKISQWDGFDWGLAVLIAGMLFFAAEVFVLTVLINIAGPISTWCGLSICQP